MNDLIFRDATSADADAIADVYLTSRKQLVPFAPLAHSDNSVRNWIHTILLQRADVTVVEKEGHIVGMMALESTPDGIKWIDQLYLHPSVVGQGIGSRLVNLAKAELGAPITLYTFQENTAAIAFYERHGFVGVEYGDGSGNEEGCPDVRMVWDENGDHHA